MGSKPGQRPFYGRPSEDGHYWHAEGDEEWEVVYFDTGALHYFVIGSEMPVPLTKTKGHKWQGPIRPSSERPV